MSEHQDIREGAEASTQGVRLDGGDFRKAKIQPLAPFGLLHGLHYGHRVSDFQEGGTLCLTASVGVWGQSPCTQGEYLRRKN